MADSNSPAFVEEMRNAMIVMLAMSSFDPNDPLERLLDAIFGKRLPPIVVPDAAQLWHEFEQQIDPGITMSDFDLHQQNRFTVFF